MISQTTEYALRAMVHLADKPQSMHTNRQIADSSHVPLPYLAKVMQSLGKAGLIISQRGPGGGFSLAKNPDEISILDVVQAVEPLQFITSCPVGLPAHEGKLCPLHRRLNDTMELVQSAFRQTTLADLLSGHEHEPPH